jgi:hypothetical protein
MCHRRLPAKGYDFRWRTSHHTPESSRPDPHHRPKGKWRDGSGQRGSKSGLQLRSVDRSRDARNRRGRRPMSHPLLPRHVELAITSCRSAARLRPMWPTPLTQPPRHEHAQAVQPPPQLRASHTRSNIV